MLKMKIYVNILYFYILKSEKKFQKVKREMKIGHF